MSRTLHHIVTVRLVGRFVSIRLVATLIIIISCHVSGLAQSTAPSLPSVSSGASDRNPLEQALQIAEQELNEARATNDPNQIGKLLHKIGIIHQKLKNSEESLKYLLWAVLTFERASAQSNVLAVKCDLGDYYFNSQSYQKAIQYYQDYLKGKKRLNEDIPDRISILKKVAQSHFTLEEYEEAEAVYLQLSKLHEGKRDMKATASSYQALADVNKQMDNIPRAIQYLEKVEKISRQTRDTPRLLQTLNNLGFLQKRNKNLKMAISYFQQALAIPLDDQNPDLRVSML
ncbi:MAG: tetratricopeptide repeat protein, partial [Bacteroidota bacterium]